MMLYLKEKRVRVSSVHAVQVSLTARFFQTMQDFFFPKAEGEGPDPGPVEPDHSHLFGVQRM